MEKKKKETGFGKFARYLLAENDSKHATVDEKMLIVEKR